MISRNSPFDVIRCMLFEPSQATYKLPLLSVVPAVGPMRSAEVYLNRSSPS